MCRAVSLLADEFPSLRFRVIGEGPALESVVRLAEDLGVADRVEFRGLVPNDQIPVMLSDAAAGISPQRGGVFGSLVFSMKVAEYVALGLPVICSGIATMRHYFSDDELLFFEPENAEDLARAIRDLLTDPAAAGERAARSRMKLDKLDWPAQKETLVETVEALAGSRKRPCGAGRGRATPWSARFAECESPGRRTRRQRSMPDPSSSPGSPAAAGTLSSEDAIQAETSTEAAVLVVGLGEIGGPLLDDLARGTPRGRPGHRGSSLRRRPGPSSLLPVHLRFRLVRVPLRLAL